MATTIGLNFAGILWGGGADPEGCLVYTHQTEGGAWGGARLLPEK